MRLARLSWLILIHSTVLTMGCNRNEQLPEISQREKPRQNASAVPGDSQPPEAGIPDKEYYANVFINQPAPEMVVEEWLTEEPSLQGKMILVDFWATWCGPCVNAIPILNYLHRRFSDRLVVVGISDEARDTVADFTDVPIEYYSAIDTQGRMKDAIDVRGIPHVLLIDPSGIVRWQGFPGAEGHELTPQVVETLLNTYVPDDGQR